MLQETINPLMLKFLAFFKIEKEYNNNSKDDIVNIPFNILEFF